MADAVARCEELGSSTIVLIRLDEESSTLHAANLGDSGFMVIRDWKAIAVSRPMKADDASPLQVGHHPEIAEPQFDCPSLAETYEIGVMEGDLVVVFTDGLTDFLFEEKIVRVTRKCLERDGGTLQDCAVKLAKKARARASHSTPYSAALPENCRADDITILVARVGKAGMGDPKVTLLGQPDDEVLSKDKLILGDQHQILGERIELEAKELVCGSGSGSGSSGLELELELECGVYSLPAGPDHGHDAWFVQGQSWLGVATETCGNYPTSLCRLCGKFSKKLVDSCGPFLGGELSPKAVVVKAARKAKDKVGKTSTLIVAALTPATGLLRVACVGDSRLLVVRGWEVIAATSPMRKGRAEEKVDDQDFQFHPFDEPVVITASGFPGEDPRKVVQTLRVRVRRGDVIVCGSRGLFESLFEARIVSILRKELVAAGGSQESAAKKLVDRARAAMSGATPRIKALADNTLDRVRRVTDVTAIVATVLGGNARPVALGIGGAD